MSQTGEGDVLQNKPTPNFKQSKAENYSISAPIIQTVSSIKEFTNNVRTFVDSFEQLLDSVENFAPSLEKVAKGTSQLTRKLRPPGR
ncbi:MAG: hypothetical protein PWQ67_863 [Clostridia bacterium]|nr:hypothetical protein [Clostridia bacterium]MDN5322409.1 hypothetical protein [Clostridia bacterium]